MTPRKMGSDRLTLWGEPAHFQSDPIATERLVQPYAMVRWTDRWGTRWGHNRGEVRQVRDNEPQL